MSTCDRCGISAWHPEARSCTHTDCAIRRAPRLPVAAVHPSGGRLLADDHSRAVIGGFVASPDHERFSA